VTRVFGSSFNGRSGRNTSPSNTASIVVIISCETHRASQRDLVGKRVLGLRIQLRRAGIDDREIVASSSERGHARYARTASATSWSLSALFGARWSSASLTSSGRASTVSIMCECYDSTMSRATACPAGDDVLQSRPYGRQRK
jgi:hypothetical protein